MLWDNRVVEAAPIVGLMKRRKFTREQVRNYCATREWRVSVVYEMKRPGDGRA